MKQALLGAFIACSFFVSFSDASANSSSVDRIASGGEVTQIQDLGDPACTMISKYSYPTSAAPLRGDNQCPSVTISILAFCEEGACGRFADALRSGNGNLTAELCARACYDQGATPPGAACDSAGGSAQAAGYSCEWTGGAQTSAPSPQQCGRSDIYDDKITCNCQPYKRRGWFSSLFTESGDDC